MICVRAGVAGMSAVLATFLATAALAATPAGEVVLTDASGDVAANALDVVGVRYGSGSDHRLRAVVTMAAAWHPSALRGGAGDSPGSICVRLYSKADPGAAGPEYLACATVAADGATLRGEVLRDRAHALPAVLGAAAITRPSHRSITIRFARSLIRAPKSVRFAVEVTMPGCARSSCVDSAPDEPTTARYPTSRDAKD